MDVFLGPPGHHQLDSPEAGTLFDQADDLINTELPGGVDGAMIPDFQISIAVMILPILFVAGGAHLGPFFLFLFFESARGGGQEFPAGDARGMVFRHPCHLSLSLPGAWAASVRNGSRLITSLVFIFINRPLLIGRGRAR